MKNVIKNSRAVFYFRHFSGSYSMKSCYGRLIGTDGKFMATVSDADIVSALKENLESGFRLLMARYREPVRRTPHRRRSYGRSAHWGGSRASARWAHGYTA